MNAYLACAPMAIVVVVVGCGTRAPIPESNVLIQVRSFCNELETRLAIEGKQYRDLNAIVAAPQKAEAEHHLLLQPSVYARDAVSHELQSELSLCVYVRNIDIHEKARRDDEALRSILRLSDGSDDVAIQEAIEALTVMLKQTNALPMSDEP